MLNVLVKNWMSAPVTTIAPEASLDEARHLMEEKKIRALPVVKEGKLAGIVTKRGLLRMDLSLLENEPWIQGVNLAEESVCTAMTQNPITVTSDTVIPKAARMMLENKITALPVVDGCCLAGILTNTDLLRFLIEAAATLDHEILVKDCMTENVVTIDEETTLLEAHRLMGVKRIRTLPVVKEDQLVGVVTRTDLMSSDPAQLAARALHEVSIKILTQPVKSVVSREVKTIRPQANITAAARLLLENKIHALCVVDENGHLSGVITESDLFLVLVQKFS